MIKVYVTSGLLACKRTLLWKTQDRSRMSSQVHEFNVEMTCEGCSNAVKKVLGKLQGSGVNDVKIDMEKQQVSVDSTLTSDQLLEALQKTGKKCSYIGVKST